MLKFGAGLCCCLVLSFLTRSSRLMLSFCSTEDSAISERVLLLCVLCCEGAGKRV